MSINVADGAGAGWGVVETNESVKTLCMRHGMPLAYISTLCPNTDHCVAAKSPKTVALFCYRSRPLFHAMLYVVDPRHDNVMVPTSDAADSSRRVLAVV